MAVAVVWYAAVTDLQTTQDFGQRITSIEARMRKMPGVMAGKETEKVCPVEHSFEHGQYTRVARCMAGVLIITATHLVAHPFFLASGEGRVLTAEGVQRLVGPCWGITAPGTKRAVLMVTDTVMVTVHATEETDIPTIERAIFAEGFNAELLEGLESESGLLENSETELTQLLENFA